MYHHGATHEALQALVGRALVDPTFRKDLLNGRRAACLAECDLSVEEQRAASAIQASDLATFARGLDGWIADRADRAAAMAMGVRAVPSMAAVA